MGLEFETEVCVTEDFSKYSFMEKLRLIMSIIFGEEAEFTGVDTIYYDIEYPDEP